MNDSTLTTGTDHDIIMLNESSLAKQSTVTENCPEAAWDLGAGREKGELGYEEGLQRAVVMLLVPIVATASRVCVYIRTHWTQTPKARSERTSLMYVNYTALNCFKKKHVAVKSTTTKAERTNHNQG